MLLAKQTLEANESETVNNLRACEKLLRAIFDKLLFNTGKSFPALYLECAVEFQEAIKERNASNETIVKLEFRIGSTRVMSSKKRTTSLVMVST